MLRSVSRLLLLALSAVASVATAAPEPETPVDLQWGVKIPLRDGVELQATLYRPQGSAKVCRAFCR